MHLILFYQVLFFNVFYFNTILLGRLGRPELVRVGLFAEEGLQNAREAISVVMKETTAEMEAACVAAPEIMDLSSIMALVGGSAGLRPSPTVPASAPDVEAERAKTAEDAEAEGDEEEDEAEESGKARLQSKLAPQAKKAASGSHAKNKAKAKVAPTRQNVPAVPKASKPVQAAAASQGNTAVPKPQVQVKEETPDGMLALDGRGLRLKESLRKNVADYQEKLAPLSDFGDQYNWKDKKAHNQRQKALQSLSNQVNNTLKRVENSTNKNGLREEHADMQDFSEQVQACVKLNTLLGSNTLPPAGELKSAIDAVTNLPAQLTSYVGSKVWLKLLEASLQHHMLYREYENYCKLLMENAHEAFGFGFEPQV